MKEISSHLFGSTFAALLLVLFAFGGLSLLEKSGLALPAFRGHAPKFDLALARTLQG